MLVSKMASLKRKRTDLSLSQKLEIVQLASEKISQTRLAQRFSCSQSTISKILRQKDEIRQDAAENKVKDRKRKRVGKADDVEKALYTWFTDARARAVPITTAILEEKARQFATALDKPSFHVTTGWLCRWKARHGIKYKKAHGEKNDADLESADVWTSTVLCDLLHNFEPRNIYNADETGIYYRALPDGTLTFSTDKLSGSKKAKDRITALVAVNMDGSDKRPLLIVGKSKQPRCFRGVQQLPLPYSNNKNAWMTGDLFRNWLVDFEKDMSKKNRFVAVVVDNCAAHPRDSADDLPHIQLVFLPPNVTSVIQPCDMGIIRNLKANYRRKIVSRIVACIDSSSSVTVSSLAKSITLLDAMHMLKVAWQDVKDSSIVNCFSKAGFVTSSHENDDNVEQPPLGFSSDEFEAFVDMDSTLECHGVLTDEDICASVQPGTEPQSDTEEEAGEDPLPQQKPRDVIQALRIVRAFIEQQGGDCNTFYMVESQVHKLVNSKTKQGSIRDFFSSITCTTSST